MGTGRGRNAAGGNSGSARNRSTGSGASSARDSGDGVGVFHEQLRTLLLSTSPGIDDLRKLETEISQLISQTKSKIKYVESEYGDKRGIFQAGEEGETKPFKEEEDQDSHFDEDEGTRQPRELSEDSGGLDDQTQGSPLSDHKLETGDDEALDDKEQGQYHSDVESDKEEDNDTVREEQNTQREGNVDEEKENGEEEQLDEDGDGHNTKSKEVQSDEDNEGPSRPKLSKGVSNDHENRVETGQDQSETGIQVLKSGDNDQNVAVAQDEREEDSGDDEQKLDDKRANHSINPKVEYVEAQTLPRAALGLFEDQVKGLPQTGEEYLKKKYGVASYPTSNLEDMLPGEIPHDDFTRAKPTNQVQFSTYTAFLEPYFRPYAEEDLSFLNQSAVTPVYHGQMPNPYTIPPLGPIYTRAWATEDGPDPGYSIQQLPTPASTDISSGSADDLSDETLDSNSVSCGPLVSRLLAAIIPDPGNSDSLTANASGADGELMASGGGADDSVDGSLSDSKFVPTVETIEPFKNSTAINPDYFSLEERLKREMKYIGVLTSADIDWASGEDDEICLELRTAQRELRRVASENASRKRKLAPMVATQMAYQEYAQILDDLDKQVDNMYIKRSRNKAKKRKGVPMPSGPEAALIDSGAVKALLDKRSRWINKIGPCFDKYSIMRTPSETVFGEANDGSSDQDQDQDHDTKEL